jgi:hypothetical protein
LVDVVLVFRSGRKAGSYLLASADDADDAGDADDADDAEHSLQHYIPTLSTFFELLFSRSKGLRRGFASRLANCRIGHRLKEHLVLLGPKPK